MMRQSMEEDIVMGCKLWIWLQYNEQKLLKKKKEEINVWLVGNSGVQENQNHFQCLPDLVWELLIIHI